MDRMSAGGLFGSGLFDAPDAAAVTPPPLGRSLTDGILSGNRLASPPSAAPDDFVSSSIAPAQAPPDGFEVEYIETILTPDQALERLNAADKPEYFLGPEGSSVALWGNVTRLGNGGTVTNGQVLTVTPQGNVLTTVTGDRAVSISESGRVRMIRLQRT